MTKSNLFRMLIAVFAITCLTTAAWAANPSGVGTPAQITKAPANPVTGKTGYVPKSSPGAMICDQMGMITGVAYDTGNGNAISGQAVFGTIIDLQVADDCTLNNQYDIDQVCGGYLTFIGSTPAQGLWLQVYADNGGAPAATSSMDEVITTLTTTNFSDPLFGLVGAVHCGTATSITLNAGTWWFNLQPVDTTGGGDWSYQARDNQSFNGGDSYGKDGGAEHGSAFGGPYGGGYGTNNWTSMANLGFGTGDAAQSIEGTIVPVELQMFVVE